MFNHRYNPVSVRAGFKKKKKKMVSFYCLLKWCPAVLHNNLTNNLLSQHHYRYDSGKSHFHTEQYFSMRSR